jgi:hypothetical protein
VAVTSESSLALDKRRLIKYCRYSMLLVVLKVLPCPRGRVCAVILEYSDMKGTRHKGPRYLASQPLGKLFGSVELVWEVLAGTFLTIDILLYNFRMSKFKYCRRLPCLSSSKFTKLSFFATKCDGWRAVGENIYYIRYEYIYRPVRARIKSRVHTRVCTLA